MLQFYKLSSFVYVLCAMIALCSPAQAAGMAAIGEGGELVDITGLKLLGDDWHTTNPYRDNKTAIDIGSGAYVRNCARCHGLEGISGGLAPDLRMLETDPESDEWYIGRVRNGARRGGKLRMPGFESALSQEAMWAIRAYVDSLPED